MLKSSAIARPSSIKSPSQVVAILIVSLLVMTCRATALANATFDKLYPGTAVARMQAIRQRARSLDPADLSGDWESTTRPKLLWAAGLKVRSGKEQSDEQRRYFRT